MIWFSINFTKKKNYPRIVFSYNTPRKAMCYNWYQSKILVENLENIWFRNLGIVDDIEICDLGQILENDKDLSYENFEYEMLLGEIFM